MISPSGEEGARANRTENFLSPMVDASSNSPDLSTSRKSVIIDRNCSGEISEVNQRFKKEQEDDVIENGLVDGSPVSVHNGSSAKIIPFEHSSDPADNNTTGDYNSGNTDFYYVRKHSFRGRQRSVSESDAMDYVSEEETQLSPFCDDDNLDVTRSLPTKRQLGAGVKAKVWEVEKSDMVILEDKKLTQYTRNNEDISNVQRNENLELNHATVTPPSSACIAEGNGAPRPQDASDTLSVSERKVESQASPESSLCRHRLQSVKEEDEGNAESLDIEEPQRKISSGSRESCTMGMRITVDYQCEGEASVNEVNVMVL